jgi:6-phosphogluconolactonase (cycloisomerase 2 family)
MAFNMWQVQGEPTGRFMIGTDGLSGFTNDGKPADDNLYVFSIASGTGTLSQVGKFATANGPTSVAVSPNGQFVYDFSLVSSTGFDGPIEGFSLSTSGVLTPLTFDASTLSPPDGGFFDQSGSYLFFHGSSAIGVYNVDSTGTPTEPLLPVGVGSGAVIYPWAVTNPE